LRKKLEERFTRSELGRMKGARARKIRAPMWGGGGGWGFLGGGGGEEGGTKRKKAHPAERRRQTGYMDLGG